MNNCGKAKVGYSGAHALKISGQKSDGPVKNNAVIFSGLNIRVFKDMQLSYMIFPDYVGENDEKRTGQYLSVDLKFTDGTFLSDLSAVDINGHGMDPFPRERPIPCTAANGITFAVRFTKRQEEKPSTRYL